MTFGRRLRELRQAKGLSQRALANKVDISFKYLSKLETGVMPHPGQEIILALAKVLEADTDELFNLAGKIPPDIINKLNIETIKGLRSLQIQHLRMTEPEDIGIDRTKSGDTQKEQETFFQALVENASDGIVVLNDKLGGVYQNPSVARIYGYEEDEMIGGDLFKLHHPDDGTAIFYSFTRLMENPGETTRNEVRYKHKDGTWRMIESLGVSLLDNPEVKGIIITFRDITEWVKERSRPEHVDEVMAKEYKLTESEHKVLRLMAEGQSNHEIAERLMLSSSTIRFHVSNILSKLGVTNRTKAVALATRCHLVA